MKYEKFPEIMKINKIMKTNEIKIDLFINS